MLKQVVAIFDATQKVRKSPGTWAEDGNLGHLEGMTAWGQLRRSEHVCAKSGVPPIAAGSCVGRGGHGVPGYWRLAD